MLKASIGFESLVQGFTDKACTLSDKSRIPSEAGMRAQAKAEAYQEILEALNSKRDLFNNLYALAGVMSEFSTQKVFEREGVNVDELLAYIMEGKPDLLAQKFASGHFKQSLKLIEEQEKAA